MIGNNKERHKTTPNIAVTLKRLIFNFVRTLKGTVNII